MIGKKTSNGWKIFSKLWKSWLFQIWVFELV